MSREGHEKFVELGEAAIDAAGDEAVAEGEISLWKGSSRTFCQFEMRVLTLLQSLSRLRRPGICMIERDMFA